MRRPLSFMSPLFLPNVSIIPPLFNSPSPSPFYHHHSRPSPLPLLTPLPPFHHQSFFSLFNSFPSLSLFPFTTPPPPFPISITTPSPPSPTAITTSTSPAAHQPTINPSISLHFHPFFLLIPFHHPTTIATKPPSSTTTRAMSTRRSSSSSRATTLVTLYFKCRRKLERTPIAFDQWSKHTGTTFEPWSNRGMLRSTLAGRESERRDGIEERKNGGGEMVAVERVAVVVKWVGGCGG